jgi:alpha-ketoglutarate-dependent taurine dioxygenase
MSATLSPRWSPYVIEASKAGIELADSVELRRDKLPELVREHLAVLIRGFAVGTAEHFERFVNLTTKNPLRYTQRSTRRTLEAKDVYTSTEHPPTLPIGLHSENSFQSSWPQHVTFCSLVVASTGGSTPLADNAMVFDLIAPEIRDEFLKRQIKYVRNFGGGLELPWQEAFQTDQREEVARYCIENRIAWTWKDGDRLMTEQILPAAIMSPVRGQPLWFNQAHLFHVTNVAPEMRTALLQALPEADLPRHAYFGDGGAIPDEYVENIRDAYRVSTVRFDWQADDVLLLDNLHVAHGRDPFTGSRKVLVAMSDALSLSDHEVVAIGNGRVSC